MQLHIGLDIVNEPSFMLYPNMLVEIVVHIAVVRH